MMAWGTCPCLYANILSGGLLRFEVSPQGTCMCDAGTGAGCTDLCRESDEINASVPATPHPGRCPCIDSVGTMHELPQVESPDLCPDGFAYLVSEPFVLDLPVSTAGSLDQPPSRAGPGPELRSVVLVV
jgi:hypothetical protein